MAEGDVSFTVIPRWMYGEAHAPLLRAVGDAIVAWAHVENSLTDLLATVISDERQSIASAIMFSPNNIETRVDIADNALTVYLTRHPPLEAPVMAIWGPIINTLNRLRKTRNKIAHGQIAIVRLRGKSKIRLLPSSLMDYRVFMYQEGQLPGMSVADITQSAAAIERASGPIARLCGALLDVEPPYGASLKKLARLAEAIQKERDLHTPIPE